MSGPTRKLLILGGSGFVGRALRRALPPSARTATYHCHAFEGGVQFDATRQRLGDLGLDLGQFGAAVMLLGESNPDVCINDPHASEALNVGACRGIVDDLAEAGLRVIFASSEFVFDGERGAYGETDKPSPILLYGQQKASMERYITGLNKPHAILRLGKVYGDEPGDRTLFTNWFEDIGRGRVQRVASDQRFSPVHVDDVVDAIITAASGALDGIVHVAGPEALSRLECLERFVVEARAVRPDTPRPEACSIHDFDLPEIRPLDVSLSIEKLINAGLTPRSIDETCWLLALGLRAAA